MTPDVVVEWRRLALGPLKTKVVGLNALVEQFETGGPADNLLRLRLQMRDAIMRLALLIDLDLQQLRQALSLEHE